MEEGILPSRSALLALTAKYRQACHARSILQLLVSLACWAILYIMGLHFVNQHRFMAIPCGMGTALFTLRLFMIQHDCGHGSFFKSRHVERWVGSFLGVLTMTPYHCWYRCHAIHHANSGKLDARGVGDIRTLTVAEFMAMPRWMQWVYRAYRHPLVLFCVGPFILFCVRQRFSYYLPASWRRERLGVYATNVALMLLALMVTGVGGVTVKNFLLFHLGSMALAASMGVWLFYVQHQFHDTYWDAREHYDIVRAALRGASYYKLPPWLRWLTANIGFHHIHHLDCRIPNYRLAECHRENPAFHAVTRIHLRDSLALIRLKLWDERHRMMVDFASALQTQDK